MHIDHHHRQGLASGGAGEDGVPGSGITVGDGERLPVIPRDLGSCEVFPQSIAHNCNGALRACLLSTESIDCV